MINPYLIGVYSTENMCIEYTLVKDDYKYGGKRIILHNGGNDVYTYT